MEIINQGIVTGIIAILFWELLKFIINNGKEN